MRNARAFLSRRILILCGAIVFAAAAGAAMKLQAPAQGAQQPSPQTPAGKTSPEPQQTSPTPAPFLQYPPPSTVQPTGLNIVVLDPAHGGTDPGARGTGGLRESDLVMEFAAQVRRALESQGLQVMQTRSGNDNPSFDDRSAMANAQQGAIFISLHVASTGLPGTVRTYVMTDLPTPPDASGLIPWDRAQAPYLTLSRELGNAVQAQLALIFRGSPNAVQTAAVRQLRTTATPAIAVEISSVVVQDPKDIVGMMPGVADAIARGVAAFRPMYVTPVQGAKP